MVAQLRVFSAVLVSALVPFMLIRWTNIDLCIHPSAYPLCDPAPPNTPQVVLITGSSMGIGADIAQVYAARGDYLILTARTKAKLDSVKAKCLSLGAAGVSVVVADVSDTGALSAAVRARGALDVLIVNHALIPLELIGEDEKSVFDQVVDTNLRASVHLIVDLLPLLHRAHGRLTVISSCGTFFYPGFLSAYTASKAGLTAFANSLRVELQLTGSDTTVTLAHLGEISTDSHMTDTQTKKGGSSEMLMITPQACASGVVRATDRRLSEAFVPTFMWPLSFLGSMEPLRAMFFHQGFLAERPDFVERVNLLTEKRHKQLTV